MKTPEEMREGKGNRTWTDQQAWDRCAEICERLDNILFEVRLGQGSDIAARLECILAQMPEAKGDTPSVPSEAGEESPATPGTSAPPPEPEVFSYGGPSTLDLTHGSRWRHKAKGTTWELLARSKTGTDSPCQWYLYNERFKGPYSGWHPSPLDAFGGDFSEFERVDYDAPLTEAEATGVVLEEVRAKAHRYRKALEEIAGMPGNSTGALLMRDAAQEALDHERERA